MHNRRDVFIKCARNLQLDGRYKDYSGASNHGYVAVLFTALRAGSRLTSGLLRVQVAYTC